MDSALTPGVTVTAIGVLIAVLSRFLEIEGPWRLVMSVGGAILAVIGFVMVWRAHRTDPS